MNKFLGLSLVVLLPSSSLYASNTLSIPSTQILYPSLPTTSSHLATLSGFTAHHAQCIKNNVATVPLQVFLQTLNTFAKQAEQRLLHHNWWVGTPPDATFCDLKSERKFQPYLQKIVIPPYSQLITFGDLHGHADAVLLLLHDLKKMGYIDDTFKLLKPHVYLSFLGDFVDRGRYGVEVLQLLLQLSNANPGRVFLVRGNHEDADLNARYGFEHELAKKYGTPATEHFKNRIYKVYDLLPVALYFGSGKETLSYGLGCHGGHEIGYDATAFLHATPSTKQFTWVGTLKRADQYNALPPTLKHEIAKNVPATHRMNFTPYSPCSPSALGFMWADCNPSQGDTGKKSWYQEGRGWVYGQDLTQYLMDKAGIKIMLRAHQHHGAMLDRLREQRGMVKLWNGKVYTLLSTPVVSNFPFRSLCILTTGDTFDQWTLQLHSQPMAQGR